jgi:uncharacterized protein with HEPN domain
MTTEEMETVNFSSRNMLTEAKLRAVDSMIGEIRKGNNLNYIEFYNALEAWAICRSAQNKLLTSYIESGY